MEGIRLENPDFLYLFVLLPPALLLFVATRWRRRRDLRAFGRIDTLSRLMTRVSNRRPWIKFLFRLSAMALLIMAAVNPQTGSRLEQAQREGIDIVVALDVSRSMMAEDISPSRLERARLSVSRLIDGLGQDRVGLVVFAGSAVTQVPVTADHRAAQMILRTLGPHSIQTQGTAIGHAIERAMAAFPAEGQNSKVLIVISDGENHGDDPVGIARIARQRGITIHTVGIGTPGGAPIPVYQNNQLSGYVRDEGGNTVVSRYDESSLRQIAEAGGGSFSPGMGADLGLGALLDEMKDMEKGVYESMVFADYESRFHYFVALALALLTLEIFIFERKNKWFNQLRLFSVRSIWDRPVVKE
ncbi:MAG: VWA domain-containing protein [Bacteroidales bacterium]